MRIHVVLDDDLVANIDQLVGTRKRSEFVRRARFRTTATSGTRVRLRGCTPSGSRTPAMLADHAQDATGPREPSNWAGLYTRGCAKTRPVRDEARSASPSDA